MALLEKRPDAKLVVPQEDDTAVLKSNLRVEGKISTNRPKETREDLGLGPLSIIPDPDASEIINLRSDLASGEAGKGAGLVMYRAPGSAANRLLSEKLAEVASTKDRGAVGDGVADDTAAITPVNIQGKFVYVPDGRFKTTLSTAQLNAAFYGPGRLLTTDSGNERERANNVINMKAPPASGFVQGNGIVDDFDGDFLSPHNTQVYVSGADTAGIVSEGSGYLQYPQAVPFYARAFYQSGQNLSAYNNANRTGWAVYDVRITHNGQGDASCQSLFVTLTSVSANPNQWCQGQPAAVLLNGGVKATKDRQILNPIEYNLADNGNDVVGKALVINLKRDNHDEHEDQFWTGVRFQSVGSKAAGSAAQFVGEFDVLFDATAANVENAIALMAGQKAHFNADPAPPHKPCPQWASGESVVADVTLRFNADKVYLAKSTGSTGGSAPTHASGTASDGGVDWEFLAVNNYKSVAKTFTTPTYMQYAAGVWEFVFNGVQTMLASAQDFRILKRLLVPAVATRVRSETATLALTADNSIVLVSATSTNPTYTLPLANAYTSDRSGRITLKRTGGGGTVTVQRAGDDTIILKDGSSATSFSLAANECVELVCDGSAAWHILYKL